MKAQILKVIRVFLFLLLLLPALLYSTSNSVNGDNDSGVEKPARILQSPDIILNDDNSFSFAVFGDSRTGGVLESSLSEALYGLKRFTPDDIEDEKDREFIIYRNHLFKQIASNFKTQSNKNQDGKFDFSFFTGDFIRQGTKAHWMEVKTTFLNRINDNESSAGKIYPVIGNHELWAGRDNEKTLGIKNAMNEALGIFFDTFPWLIGDTGYETTGLHHYAFFVEDSVFITLCTGNLIFDDCFPDNGDCIFLCDQSTFGEQMDWFEEVLNYGIQSENIKNVFVQYHKPSYSTNKHKPLKQCCDPVNVMSEFKSDYPYMNMFVFNGHNHTTELYRTDSDVTVLVAGGGGAPQDIAKSGRDWSAIKETPDELFWNSLKPHIDGWQTRISYYVVTVNGADVELQEMCLTNSGGFYRFEKGIKITKQGNIISPDHITGILEH